MSDPVQALRHRLIGTMLPVAVGATLGFYYWKWFVGGEGSQNLAAAYAAAGAASVLLAVRVFTLLRMIASDFFSR